MNFYEVRPVDFGEWVLPVHDGDFERFQQFGHGVPLRDRWDPIEMRLLSIDEGRKLSSVDMPWFRSTALVLKQRAVELIGSELERWGELLPLRCSGSEMVAFNALTVVDALDESRSALVRYSSGRIMRAERLELRSDAVGDVDIFHIPQFPAFSPFFSDRFVDRFRATGLTGIQFQRAWPRESQIA